MSNPLIPQLYVNYFLQIRYHWPHEKVGADGAMVVKEIYDAKRNAVAYMSDELGLHRVENTSQSDGAVSLHLYSPPFQSCQVKGQFLMNNGLKSNF